jgi:hypothetical protein
LLPLEKNLDGPCSVLGIGLHFLLLYLAGSLLPFVIPVLALLPLEKNLDGPCLTAFNVL